MADVDQALSDIDDEITLIKSRLDSISTGTGTGTSNSIGLEDFKSKNFSLIQTAAIQNKSGDNSVTFGEANDSSNSNFSITAGKNVTTSTGHDFVSIFGENWEGHSKKIKENWIDDVTDECITIMYNGNDALTRIRQLNHKLGLISEEYSIYLKNKILNH